MTEAQYNEVNQIRLAHGYSPLARRYKDTGPSHQAKQIARALKVCSPSRKVEVFTSEALFSAFVVRMWSGDKVCDLYVPRKL